MDEPHPFARMFQRFRGLLRSRTSRRRRIVPMTLERLEERCVTTVSTHLEAITWQGPGHAAEAFDTFDVRVYLSPGLDVSSSAKADLGQTLQTPIDDQTLEHLFALEDPDAWLVDGFEEEGAAEYDPWVDPDAPAPPGSPDGFPPIGDSLWTPGDSGMALTNPGLFTSDVEDSLAPGLTVDSLDSASQTDGLSQGYVIAESMSARHSSTPTEIAKGARTEDASTSPLVTVSLCDSERHGLPGEAGANLFRITRTPGDGPPLQVAYRLTAFSSGGLVERDGVATLPPGTAHVHVAGDWIAEGSPGHEIVTLTLKEGAGFRIAPATVTLFLAGPARSCSEAALVEAYRQSRSPEAFAALVERHHPTVLRTCHQILGSWHDAEDVSQMVFLALVQRQVRLQTTLAGWLRTVARNASIAFLRSRNRRSRHERRAAKPLLAPAGDSARDLREHLDAALTHLAPPLREAVRLRYLEGWSQKEAAHLLGCPRGTLAQRATHGIRFLRGLLGPNEESAGSV